MENQFELTPVALNTTKRNVSFKDQEPSVFGQPPLKPMPSKNSGSLADYKFGQPALIVEPPPRDFEE